MKPVLFVSGLLLAATAAHAETVKPWQTSAELGAITTSGNTSGTSVTGKIDARQETTNWSNEYILSAFFKEDSKKDANGDTYTEKAAEKYTVSAKGGYKLDKDHGKLFMLGSHTRDEFGAYLDYSLFAAGYGDRLFQSDNVVIEGEVGPGYYIGKTSDDLKETGMMLRTAASLEWTISSSAKFRQTLSYEAGADNKRTIAESSISTKINGSMQMKAAFLAQHDSLVPMGKKSTDTQTSLTLVYSF